MQINEAGRKLIKSFESLRLEAYQDSVSVWTIGWGHIKGVKKGDICSQQQAEIWLTEDLTEAEASVERVVKVKLNGNEFGALVSFVFNLGVGSLKKSTLLKLLNAGDFNGAALEFKKWNKAGGKVLTGLTRRRTAEAQLFTLRMETSE
jgi:lysozyme